MIYGVFIIKHGEWALWATYTSKQQAIQERDYLVRTMGIEADIFAKAN